MALAFQKILASQNKNPQVLVFLSLRVLRIAAHRHQSSSASVVSQLPGAAMDTQRILFFFSASPRPGPQIFDFTVAKNCPEFDSSPATPKNEGRLCS